jgi:hypothetical protein
MKTKEITSGVYVACRLNEESNQKINKFIKDFKIPDFSDGAKSNTEKHVTIIYSTIYDYITPAKYSYFSYGNGFDIFDTKVGAKCLVLKLNCPSLLKRHKELMSSFNLNYSFERYVPHITLSYDIGNFEWNKIPNFSESLILQNEFVEELKP